MNAIDRLSDSGTALVRQARRTFESTSSHLPQWLEAGAVMSMAKTGTKAATTLARRNPGVVIAIGVLGAGVLAYRLYRRRAAARLDAPKAAISGKISRSQADADGANGANASAKRTRKPGKTKADKTKAAQPRPH